MREDYKIDLQKIPTGDLRDQVEIVDDFLSENMFAKAKFQWFEIVFDQARANYKVKHGLSRTPKDAWISYISPDSGVTATLNYDEFDGTYFDITVSAACTVRVVVGLFKD